VQIFLLLKQLSDIGKHRKLPI